MNSFYFKQMPILIGERLYMVTFYEDGKHAVTTLPYLNENGEIISLFNFPEEDIKIIDKVTKMFVAINEVK